MFLVGRYQDHIYWYPGLETYRYHYIIITMSLFNVIGFNKKIPFTDIGKKICICHKPSDKSLSVVHTFVKVKV